MGLIKNLHQALQELNKMRPGHNLFGHIDRIEYSINEALKQLINYGEHEEELIELFEKYLKETGGFVNQVGESEYRYYTPTEEQYQQAFAMFKNNLV